MGARSCASRCSTRVPRTCSSSSARSTWCWPAPLLDQRVAGQAEDALADLVALDLGGAAGDRHGAVHQHEHVAHAARTVHVGGVGAVELGEDGGRVVTEL